MNDDQTDPSTLAVHPVSVADQDRVLVRRDDIFVAVVAVRVYPQAVMFQQLIKAHFTDDEQPNLAFGMPHLLQPGNFEFGAELRDAAGAWHPTTAHFGGGGGGEYARADTESHYEFKWWLPLSVDDRGLRLWCAWEERGVPKTEAELDIDRIHAAARASQPIWPA